MDTRESAMHWNVAQAKQRLSEVIREAAREPQTIYNRNAPVAVVIAAEELAEYQAWKQSRGRQTTLAEEFDRLRGLAAGDANPLPEPDRLAVMRPNAFEAAFAEDDKGGRDTPSDAAH